MKALLLTLILILSGISEVISQSFLPPLIPWKGKSEKRMESDGNPFVTPFEVSNGTKSATVDQLNKFLAKLMAETPLIRVDTIGLSAEGRPILLVKVSSDINFLAGNPARSTRPTLFFQAGIHAGEIDGKDAGMMLIRELLVGKNKKLTDEVNLLFIPILNIDGHERASALNRINQRGPEIQGWRTNAQNLNLNRDYSKLDTEEIQAVVGVMNKYDPDLYMDIHVTDGADYQYDITYGFTGTNGYSPDASAWLKSIYKPFIDRALKDMNHIPGPLVFSKNGIDFSQGNEDYTFSPRYSHGYGDARHIPSILVENHSLKPFRQRVLGTLVLLENTMNILSNVGYELRNARKSDQKRRNATIPLAWKFTEQPADSVMFLGIETGVSESPVSGGKAVEWKGKPFQQKIALWSNNQPVVNASRPLYYIIPAGWKAVNERINLHGIHYELLAKPETLEVEMYRFTDVQAENKFPWQGRFRMSAKAITEKRKQLFPAGSLRISTDQPLGDLAILLLEPDAEDSFFQWGFFNTILERTEYFEAYVMEKYALEMLAKSPQLKTEFEEKIKSDLAFSADPRARLHWFYEKTAYNDDSYLLYPIGIVR